MMYKEDVEKRLYSVRRNIIAASKKKNMKNIKLVVAYFLVANCWILPLASQPIAEIGSGVTGFHALGIPRRIIAIDNVCAWPNLSVLKDGTIVASIFNQPTHGRYEGDIECWTSVDQGLNWEYRSTPTQHEPYTVRMNHAAGVNKDGHLIVLCGGWDNIRPELNEESYPLEMSLSISKNGGETWEHESVGLLPVEGLGHLTPFGDIMIAANGDLVLGTYAFERHLDESKSKNEREGHVYIVRSQDGGRSWNHLTPIVKGTHVEAALLHLGNGKWLAASRRFGYTDLDIHTSTDDGFTWSQVTVLGIPSVSAAHLLKLSDGRILLSYGNRNPGNKGIDVRVSNNEGQSWSAPQRVVDLKETNDLGYPAAVELSNGHIMMAYYSSGIQQHGRYHMGIVNFLIDELVVKLPD